MKAGFDSLPSALIKTDMSKGIVDMKQFGFRYFETNTMKVSLFYKATSIIVEPNKKQKKPPYIIESKSASSASRKFNSMYKEYLKESEGESKGGSE